MKKIIKVNTRIEEELKLKYGSPLVNDLEIAVRFMCTRDRPPKTLTQFYSFLITMCKKKLKSNRPFQDMIDDKKEARIARDFSGWKTYSKSIESDCDLDLDMAFKVLP